MAYQIAFDLYEGATQQFLSGIITALKASVSFVTGKTAIDSSDAKADKNGTPETPRYITFRYMFGCIEEL